MLQAKPNVSIPSLYIGRFAPSPTGPLHLGSLATALASYLEARCRNGVWHLRIDDSDTIRADASAADGILATLAAHGLRWDHHCVRQSEQTLYYMDAIERLRTLGRLFACDCSRKSLRDQPNEAGAHRVYPGTCKKRANAEIAPPFAWRLLVDETPIEIVDALQGRYGQNLASDVGDFVVQRRDGIYAYHLASVIDDQRLGVTHVVRGVDLLESTPRQVFLQRLLNAPTPSYSHLPVLIDTNGCKLSKQTGASPIDNHPPAANLHRVLKLLRQNPPLELAEASVERIVEWARAHWTTEPLRGVQALVVAG